jgi:steroid delta-isomerase-like uncharacterized protein
VHRTIIAGFGNFDTQGKCERQLFKHPINFALATFRINVGIDYDEWGVMNWVWKATHNMDFLELPAKGKTTYTRGMTFHLYRERKVVREFTFWNFRGVAIQLGAFKPQEKFWLEGYKPPAA